MVKVDSVVRVKLNELQLNIISDEGSERTIGLLLMNVNIVIQFIKNSVVFWSYSFPFSSSLYKIYSTDKYHTLLCLTLETLMTPLCWKVHWKSS